MVDESTVLCGFSAAVKQSSRVMFSPQPPPGPRLERRDVGLHDGKKTDWGREVRQEEEETDGERKKDNEERSVRWMTLGGILKNLINIHTQSISLIF